MQRISVLTAVWLVVTLSPARAEPPDLSAVLAENSYSLALDSGRLAGEGAAWLTAAARHARYVLVGEVHGIAESAELAEALFHALHSAGFETYVTEVDPWSARRLHALAEQENAEGAFSRLFGRYPFAIPFATYLEEADLLATVAHLSDASEPIWGLDQAFFLGPQMLLDDLARRTTGDARDALESLAAAERESYRAIVEGGSPNVPTFMSRPLPETWPVIRAAFEAPSHGAELALIADLELSREIYGHFFAGRSYLNNRDRARLMKRNLARYLERHGQDTKLIVKLGAVHVARGLSPMTISDVGNTLAELAAMAGEESLHLLVVPTGGTQNTYLPFLPPETRSTPIDVESASYNLVRPLLDALPASDGWSLHDLRPLRPTVKRLTSGSPRLEALILGYDVVVIIPQAEAAELFESILG